GGRDQGVEPAARAAARARHIRRADAALPRHSLMRWSAAMADDGCDPGIGTGGADLSGTLGGLQMRTRGLAADANAFARAMTTAFARSAVSGKSFDDTLKSLALRLSDLSVRLALRPVTNALGGGLTGLFGGLFGTPANDTDLLKAMNTAQPFASGGVIASPGYFPLASGGLGLAGEAGPESYT